VAAGVALRSTSREPSAGSSGKIAFSERIIDPKDDVYRIVVMNTDGSGRRPLPANALRHSCGRLTLRRLRSSDSSGAERHLTTSG
jgi:hypothetical protein